MSAMNASTQVAAMSVPEVYQPIARYMPTTTADSQFVLTKPDRVRSPR